MIFRSPLLALLLAILLLGACKPQQQELVVGGGPSGGTYQGYAEAMLQIVSAAAPDRRWRVKASAGSVDNLLDVNDGQVDLALAYSGDAWLGRRGLLPDDQTKLQNVRALGRLYDAAAQLVVRRTSPIAQLSDLSQTRIAIGNPGSGTALAARRYFSSLGLWRQIVPIHVGFSMGLKELGRGSVEAVWLVVGYPNRALTAESGKTPLRFLDLYSEARESGFFREFPFYSEMTIPAGTYPGQQRRIWTFQENTLLIARADLDPDLTYRLLRRLYSVEGMATMAELHPIGAQLDQRLGLDGVRIPLHPGAERYWKELDMH